MTTEALLPVERIESVILFVRGDRVILDADIAALFGVETKALVRAVKRNLGRFPQDFMFQLTTEEVENLRYQFGTSSSWGGRRYLPYAFTGGGAGNRTRVRKASSPPSFTCVVAVSPATGFADSAATYPSLNLDCVIEGTLTQSSPVVDALGIPGRSLLRAALPFLRRRERVHYRSHV
jgi:ORF6N domain-containing protein